MNAPMSRFQEVLLLVGQLNYTWTNTESLLIYMISHLMGTSKEAAIVTFLSLNTTRARLDFLERLAKMKSIPASTRTAVIEIVSDLKLEGKIRNKYNHCIYSFNERGELESTQLLRIAEIGNDLKYGKVEELNASELGRIDASIASISGINRAIWKFVAEHHVQT